MLEQDVGNQVVTAGDTTIARQYLEFVSSKVQLREDKKEGKELEKPAQKILEIHEIAEGLRVWHRVFGVGTVLEVKDRKQGRLTVLFEEHGKMILLAAYARLQPFR
jgi:hypothetical protein